MTENESFELRMNDNGQLDIIDHLESEEKNAICIYNDLGVPPFSSAKALCDKLNEQYERIRILEVDNADYKSEIEYYEEQKAELEKEVESKEKVIRAFEDYINILKEDGVLDD